MRVDCSWSSLYVCMHQVIWISLKKNWCAEMSSNFKIYILNIILVLNSSWLLSIVIHTHKDCLIYYSLNIITNEMILECRQFFQIGSC